MALTQKQADTVVDLFSGLFAKSDQKEERKEIFLEFEDVFGKGIYDWKTICREKMEQYAPDKEIIEHFDTLANRKKEDNNKYLVRELDKTDIKEVRELINRAFHSHLTSYDEEKIEKFVGNGYSLVACCSDEILGVILGYVMPDLYSGAIYIDTFTVTEAARGYGIGTKLISHIEKYALSNKIYTLKLHTDKTKKAYQIYKHLGFQESENVLMRKEIY